MHQVGSSNPVINAKIFEAKGTELSSLGRKTADVVGDFDTLLPHCTEAIRSHRN
jgi:hypothetical protein